MTEAYIETSSNTTTTQIMSGAGGSTYFQPVVGTQTGSAVVPASSGGSNAAGGSGGSGASGANGAAAAATSSKGAAGKMEAAAWGTFGAALMAIVAAF